MTTGEKIRRLRKERDMTQEELGEAIGVQKAAINKYEIGTVVNLKRSVIMKISDIFGVNPIWLMDDNEGWPPMLESRKERPFAPKTPEARILAKGIDSMPQEQREAIITMMTGLYPNVFKKGPEDDDT